jgi:hypothetical protein
MKRPPRYATIAKIALGFPGVEETIFHGAPWFEYGGSKGFVLYSPNEERWIFKLPKHQQMMLFDTRPKTFTPMRAGRMIWSFVKAEDLDAAELRDLVTAAWTMVAPKKVVRMHLEGHQ